MDNFLTFAKMGGYGIYVWPSYGLVFCLLAYQLLKPWYRWRKLNHKEKPPL